MKYLFFMSFVLSKLLVLDGNVPSQILKTTALPNSSSTIVKNTNYENRIFVSIASYRDRKCPETLKFLFNKAKNPERVFVGLVQQNSPTDIDCTAAYQGKWKDNIRYLKLEHFEAKGPTWARYLCSRLFHGEEYYFQIDSHTQFAPNWDEKLINMIQYIEKNTSSRNAVISHYPPPADESGIISLARLFIPPFLSPVPVICDAYFDSMGMISFLKARFIYNFGLPVKGSFVGAGMMFLRSDFLNRVPFDPNLPFLFVGEEILFTTRLWTHGWDIYAPSESVVYHYYTRKNEPKFFDDLFYDFTYSSAKVMRRIGLTPTFNATFQIDDTNQFNGLGSNRTLDQFYEYAGIDVVNKRIIKSTCVVPNAWITLFQTCLALLVLYALITFLFRKKTLLS